MESHFCRETTKRQYMSSNLNVTTLYELYKTKMKKENAVTVGPQTYRNIFMTKFNIGFHKPKKDACSICIKLQNAKPSERAELESEHTVHQTNKLVARSIKKMYKEMAMTEDDSVRVYAFDLQKVLNVPHGGNGLFFYSRRLSIYNLTVTNLATMEGYCYTWDQTQAKRGSNEIASCLNTHLSEPDEVPDATKSIIFFADNCTGQNKNRFVLQMLSLFTIKTGISTHLIFLEKGHTQNCNDTMHSNIEKAKKGIEIDHPEQWIGVMQMACKKQPYSVRKMNREDVRNYKTPLGGMYDQLIDNKTTHNVTGKRVKMNWMKLRHVSFEKPNTRDIVMLYKYDLTVPFQAVVIGKLPQRTRQTATQPIPPVQFERTLPITKALKKDLIDLCKENAIRPDHHPYFHSLATSDDIVEDDNDNIDPNRDCDDEPED